MTLLKCNNLEGRCELLQGTKWALGEDEQKHLKNVLTTMAFIKLKILITLKVNIWKIYQNSNIITL